MAIYVVAIESGEPEFDPADFAKRLKERGDDCQTMNNLWCIRSPNTIQELFNFLSEDVLNNQDKLFIAEIHEGWLTQNTKGEGDCFEDEGKLHEESSFSYRF
jgi:hypothetical protein